LFLYVTLLPTQLTSSRSASHFYAHHRHLHSFPTRRSSDLIVENTTSAPRALSLPAMATSAGEVGSLSLTHRHSGSRSSWASSLMIAVTSISVPSTAVSSAASRHEP